MTGVGVGSQTLGRLHHKFGLRRITTVCSAMLAVVIVLFITVQAGTSLWWVRVLMFFIGFVNSGGILAMQASMFTRIEPSETGHASAIYNALGQGLLAVSVAFLSTVVSVVGTTFEGFDAAFVAAAVMGARVGIAAWSMIRDDLAAEPRAPNAIAG